MPSLTYAELAKALRITPESANRLARRKRWPRVKGNDGRTRVMAPEDFCPPGGPQDDPTDSVTIDRIVAELAKIGFSDIRRALDWGMTAPDADGNSRQFVALCPPSKLSAPSTTPSAAPSSAAWS
jgi:hypothetical protein